MAHYHCNICDSHCGSDECKEVYFGNKEGFVLRRPEIGGQGESFICIKCLDRLKETLMTTKMPVHVCVDMAAPNTQSFSAVWRPAKPSDLDAGKSVPCRVRDNATTVWFREELIGFKLDELPFIVASSNNDDGIVAWRYCEVLDHTAYPLAAQEGK